MPKKYSSDTKALVAEIMGEDGPSKAEKQLMADISLIRRGFKNKMSRKLDGSLDIESMYERMDGIDDSIDDNEFAVFVTKLGNRIATAGGTEPCPPIKRIKDVFRKISGGDGAIDLEDFSTCL